LQRAGDIQARAVNFLIDAQRTPNLFMILDILTAPNEVLTTPCEDAVPGPETSMLLHSMIETLQVMPEAIGLAAPQVGVSIRAFVMGTQDQGYLAMLNPRIKRRSGTKQKVTEGCLSLPGKKVVMKRADSITVVGLDAEGKTFTFTAKGMAAAVVQHEIDHLSGILLS
jgi:peptide deformylase